jgi:hypothetical protein
MINAEEQYLYSVFRFAGLTFVIVLLASCENDIPLIDDYRETMIIYGLINPNEPASYVRVQRAFLGEGNAYLMAQHADSIYYDTSEIDVTLQKISNGVALDSFIHFTPVTDIVKEEGLFVNAPHIVFKSVDYDNTAKKDDYIDKQASYKLTVFNKRLGHTVSATTAVVGDPILNPASPLLYPSFSVNLAQPFKVDVTFPQNARILNLTLKFNYVEFTTGTNFFENKSLTYTLEDVVSGTGSGVQDYKYEIEGSKLFAFIASFIDPDPALYRPAELVTVDFIFTAGAEEFYNYYAVSTSSALLNDVIPVYSNLTGGIGIFSSRNTRIFAGKKLTGETLDSLANGQYTGDLFD